MPTSRPGWGKPCDWPDMARVTFSNGTRVTVNAGIAELVEILGNETIRRGYEIRSGVTGGYNCRAISGTNSWSNHSWGLALDINWDTNPWRRPLTTDMPAWMVGLWVGYGFRWGGTYSTPDAMHYEFMGTRTDANVQTARARTNILGQQPATRGLTMATDHIRILDTRQTGGRIGVGGEVSARLPAGKPDWARAAFVNVTLLDTTAPVHATSKWSDGDTSVANNDGGVFANPNLALLKFSPDGNHVSVKLGGPGAAHIIVDFQGWSG